MSKPIKCPKCRAVVKLRKFGFVSEHQRADSPQKFCEQSGMKLPGWMPTKQADPQDQDDARQREAVLQQTIVDLQKVLFNTTGLDRLANLTDEEWAEAESADEG